MGARTYRNPGSTDSGGTETPSTSRERNSAYGLRARRRPSDGSVGEFARIRRRGACVAGPTLVHERLPLETHYPNEGVTTKIALVLLAETGVLKLSVAQEPPKPAPGNGAKEVVVVKAANVKWVDHPFVEGAKMCVLSGDPAKGPAVIMMKFGKGTVVPAHWHTADETVTIVSGTAIFGTGETEDAAKCTEVTSGSYAVIPGGSPYWAIAKDELIITVAVDKAVDFHPCAETKKPK